MRLSLCFLLAAQIFQKDQTFFQLQLPDAKDVQTSNMNGLSPMPECRQNYLGHTLTAKATLIRGVSKTQDQLQVGDLQNAKAGGGGGGDS